MKGCQIWLKNRVIHRGECRVNKQKHKRKKPRRRTFFSQEIHKPIPTYKISSNLVRVNHCFDRNITLHFFNASTDNLEKINLVFLLPRLHVKFPDHGETSKTDAIQNAVHLWGNVIGTGVESLYHVLLLAAASQAELAKSVPHAVDNDRRAK